MECCAAIGTGHTTDPEDRITYLYVNHEYSTTFSIVSENPDPVHPLGCRLTFTYRTSTGEKLYRYVS